jgi:2-keto-4-pentenoate hydratase/2-oxohepta-3-ene-1,7-dioic acid hydratase in catechol pathway
MKLCRFNQDRLGIVEGDAVYDVTAAFEGLTPARWPLPHGDPLILQLGAILQSARRLRPTATRHALDKVTLYSPITQPTKVMAAPANYKLHVSVDVMNDPGIDHGVHKKALEGVERPVDKYGLFLKAASSIVGPHEGVEIVFPERRTDHEIELAVVIGKAGREIPRAQAMEHVVGYTIGLDITVRGAEERSYRKSADSYTVLGPVFVTADEIADPHALDMSLWVNGQRRQHSSTGAMTVDIPDLIEFASRVYTLHPGDVILTGTPEGVGPLVAGDVVRVAIDGIGEMSFGVRGRAPRAA